MPTTVRPTPAPVPTMAPLVSVTPEAARVLAHTALEVYTREAGRSFSVLLPTGQVVYGTVTERSHPTETDACWDQVHLAGQWCGNRHGGVEVLLALVLGDAGSSCREARRTARAVRAGLGL